MKTDTLIIAEYNEALAAYLQDESRENWRRLSDASKASDELLRRSGVAPVEPIPLRSGDQVDE